MYVRNTSSITPLYYGRSKIKPGSKIDSDYLPNTKLINALQNCNKFFVNLYLKPLGDSILFLSVVNAAVEYLRIVRPKSLPPIYAQEEMRKLFRHCKLFKGAKFIRNIEDVFKNKSKKEIVAMVTDSDPFQYFDPSYVYNTESYLYPKFIEKVGQGSIKEYTSRPARYYLTFEREVGIVLGEDPNKSMPYFIMNYSKNIEEKLHKMLIEVKNDVVKIGIISYVGQNEIQKQFGVLRYLKVAKLLSKKSKKKLSFVVFINKSEEKADWKSILKFINKNKTLDIYIYEGRDLEEIAYVLARMKLNIGNDTGISHLATLCRKSESGALTQTFITYSRHDYDKWNTGLGNVTPVSSRLADYLTQKNKSISKDNIDLKKWKGFDQASKIPILALTDKVLAYIEGIK